MPPLRVRERGARPVVVALRIASDHQTVQTRVGGEHLEGLRERAAALREPLQQLLGAAALHLLEREPRLLLRRQPHEDCSA